MKGRSDDVVQTRMECGMKGIVAAFFVLLIAAGCAGMDMRMHRVGSSAPADDRTELKIPDEMKLMQKKMMRAHLATIGRIVEALSEDDLEEAGEIARKNLGWNPEEERRCAKVAAMSGEKDFFALGRAMHEKADEFVAYTTDWDKPGSLKALSELIGTCNACHRRFRH